MKASKASRSIRTLALAAVLCVAAPAGLALGAPPQTGAAVTVTGSGQVTIDGAAASTGATLFSGSRITTSAGAGATIAVGETRVNLGEDADAVVSFTSTTVRVDVVCGSASVAAAAGVTFEFVTQNDTNVHAQTGSLRVAAEGKASELSTDQQQSYAGGTRVTAPGGSAFEAATILCSCKCAAPVLFPVAPVVAAVGGGFPGIALAAIIGGAAAAVLVPIFVNDDEPDQPVSPSSPA